MRQETLEMEVKKTSTSTGGANLGTPRAITDLQDAAVFAGTKDGNTMVGCTVVIQGSISPMNEWIDIATLDNTALTAGSRTAVPTGFTRLRAKTTGYSSGTPSMWVAGRNSQSG